MMDQKELWDAKWEERHKEQSQEHNTFAKEALSLMQEKQKKRILELGCGDGRDTFYLAKNGMDLTAIDFSQKTIKHIQSEAKEQNININLICEDIRKIQFPENSFDAIYAHLSLHYFDDETTTQIFNNIHTILRPEGLLFVKCKSTDDTLFGKGKELDKDRYELKGHIRHFFSEEYMQSKLQRFSIISMKKTKSVYHSYECSFIEAVAKK